jgi:hypothetical protein
MSAETPRLKFQPIPEGIQVTADTWAEALNRIDAFCDLYLLGQFANTPPASPADGDAYLTGGAPGGAWTNQAYKIASCLDGQWRFYTPFNGLRAYVAPSGGFIVYLNGQWLDWNSLLSASETAIASAATCDLGAANALFVQITGTTTITSFGSGANKLRFVRFAQALTLTHNAAALILLGNASRTTAAGDVGLYASDASGNWRERAYFRAATNPGDAATKSGSETLAAKILSSPVVAGALALTGAGGGQIVFPATQNPSSNPNTLDDYEEGTFVPVFQATGNNPVLTYGSSPGVYVKIGKLVICNFGISVAAVNAPGSGSLLVGGLPFVALDGTGVFVIGSAGAFQANNPSCGRTEGGTSYLWVRYKTAANGGVNDEQASELQTSSYVSGCLLIYQAQS